MRHLASFRHPVSIVGVLVTTAAAVVFLALVVAAAAGLFENPYAGLVIFILLPAIFVLGLLLVALGAWLARRSLRRHPGAVRDWPVLDFGNTTVRRMALAITALTAVNVVILLVAGYGSLHWMESPSFCGQVCHTPMHPQFTAWQANSHSRVECVQCHIGEGGRAFVRYKLAGVRQLAHVLTNNYPRPIPAAMADLRPAFEVCGSCHDAQLNFGERVRAFHEYADDEAVTETATVMRMLVGGPGQPTRSGRAIHWHADPAVRIEYVAAGADRQTIRLVKLTRPDGRVTEFTAEGTAAGEAAGDVTRVMDCIDCHNAATHRIAPTAAGAVDRAIEHLSPDHRLPFLRREAVRLVTAEYPDQESGLNAIERELRGFYASRQPAPDALAIEAALSAVKNTYRQNVFPTMKVTFGVYPDNQGHTTSNGCFRCHDGSFAAKDGTVISGDCDYCHIEVEGSPAQRQAGLQRWNSRSKLAAFAAGARVP